MIFLNCRVLFLIILLSNWFVQISAITEKSIVIVVASYNNRDWYKRNLDSVFFQKYKNYRLIYIDDCSPDGTYELVRTYIKEKEQEHRVVLLHNIERRGAMENQYNAICSCDNNEIILILDGDDWFAHDHVLSFINRLYTEHDIWLTYGQFREYPSGAIGFCCPMPKYVIENNDFRSFVHIPSHLRTFYAGLFKKIKKEDLMYDGNFVPMTGDIAAMFPMIEMARDHFKFVPDILYIYNAANSLNNYKVSKKLEREIDLIIRSRKRYDKINNPFDEL